MGSKTPTPAFFQWRIKFVGGNSTPTAEAFTPKLRSEVCSACGSSRQVFDGPASCHVRNAVAWPDAIGIVNWPVFLVSARVVRALLDLGQSGFESRPVSFKQIAPKCDGRPDYFFLDVRAGIDIGRVASGLGRAEHCAGCFQYLGKKLIEPKRYVPVPETWRGVSVFRMRNNPNMETFCTLDVVERARLEGWSNVRFEPMDVVRKDAMMWGGIDYLGTQWPPREWYPESPLDRHSIEEWVTKLRTEPHPQYVSAHQALMDIGTPAVPHLVPLLTDESPTSRKRAARILAAIHRRHDPLPEALKLRLIEMLKDDPDFLGSVQKG